MPALVAGSLRRLLHTQMTQKLHDVLKLQHKHTQRFVPIEKCLLNINLGGKEKRFSPRDCVKHMAN